MPIVNFHLLVEHNTPEQHERLLKEASRLYSEVLNAPLERVRAFITAHPAEHFAVGREICRIQNLYAPYFEFMVLEGRSLEERQRLHQGFTELLANTLGVYRELIRGVCKRVAPEDWSIGGTLASVVRAEEVTARVNEASAGASYGA